ncbi:cytochrome oxidase small assembly protein [Limnohabitans sp. G3-2]|uniref:cytochrome oxidase small assembly protein n=1 Tax=Limnohabitans sp. G3-2 TaxID=1100711 RepID=UPI00350EAB58
MGSAFACTFPHLREPTQAGRYRNPRDRLIDMAMTPEQRKSNVRLGLILASVACAVLIGFVAKLMLLNS